MADAGYADGFEVTLDCPNNRYVNDEQICIALAGMWAQIKVKVKVNAMPRATYFPRLEKYDFSMYMLGWGGAVTDAETTLTPVMRNNLGDEGRRLLQLRPLAQRRSSTRSPAQSSTEADPKKREALIKAALRGVQGAVHDAAAAPPGDPVGGARERRRRPPRRQLVRGVLGDKIGK